MRVHWPQKAKEDNLHHLTNATYRCVLEMERVLTDSGRSERLEGSDLDQHLQQTPFTLCALTAAIILPRAAIVSLL